jgi:nickel-dependent lactate racemase
MIRPFSYPDVPPVEIPDANALATLVPREIEPPQPLETLVEEALDRPIGSSRVEEHVSPSTRVLILVDDTTRQTPAWNLLPSLFRRLEQRGCPRQNVKILIAAGTHARMSPQQIEQKLGPRIPQEYQVLIHHWRAEENLRSIGETADGTPIRVHRLLSESDLVIGVGQIVPHRVMGYTGGCTIVQPGVCGGEVTGYTHWKSALYSGQEILGIAENPVRQEVEQIGRKAGLRFILNVVMDAQHRVIHVVAGDPVAAHRQGAEYSRAIYGVSQPELADIVVVESYPTDIDLWVAAKGIYAAELAVHEGGAVILVSPCTHGVAPEHPDVERIGYHDLRVVQGMLERKEIADVAAAAHLVHVGRVICSRARGIMVSPGIDPQTQRHLGFEPASTPQKGLDVAFGLVGPLAKVVVLRQGGHILPLVQGTLVQRARVKC